MATTNDGKATKGFIAACANGGVSQSIADTEIELDFSSITSGKGIQLDLDGLTTGTGLEIRVDSDVITLGSGKALDIKAGSAMGTSVMAVDVSGITLGAGQTIGCASTGASGWILSNLKYAAETNLTGTTQTVEVYLDGTPYYFSVYPTKD